MLRNVRLGEIHNIQPVSAVNEKNAVAVFSDLAPLEPTYALVAGVDLVVIRLEEEIIINAPVARSVR